MKRICVNCGSSPGFDPSYMEMAHRLGQALLDRNLELVYGGADVGLMGEVADTVLKAGGSAIGVIPKSFAQKVSHDGLTELHVVESMHERKGMMFDLSDGFIALPGGFGTLDELFEMLTRGQLGLHDKPVGVLNTNGFFDHLFSAIDRMVDEGFLKDLNRDMVLVNDCIETLVDSMRNYAPPRVRKWIMDGKPGEDTPFSAAPQ